MSIITLFILTASLLASLWAGRLQLHEAAIVWFVAVYLTDVLVSAVTTLNKWHQTRVMEVTLNGMAEGEASQGLREQIGRTAREAWNKAQRDANEGKGN